MNYIINYSIKIIGPRPTKSFTWKKQQQTEQFCVIKVFIILLTNKDCGSTVESLLIVLSPIQ